MPKSAITKDRIVRGDTKNTYKHADDILAILSCGSEVVIRNSFAIS